MEGNKTDSYGDTWWSNFIVNVGAYITLVVIGWLLVRYYKKKLASTTTNTSHGPLHRLLTFCILGNPMVELEMMEEGGGNSSHDNPQSPRHHCTVALWRRGLQLVCCIMGLQVSYLTWGVMQERIVTGTYDGVMFHDSQFLVFSNRVLALISSGLFIFFTRQPRHVTPFYKYSFSSLSNIISSWCQYEALNFISFPTQVLAKSCKVIPVMIMGRIVSNKTYPFHEYITALMISMGVSMFLLTANQSLAAEHTRETELTGVVILIGYLLFDSFTSNWQAELFKEYKMSSVQMMFGTNVFSFTFTGFSLILRGKLFTSLMVLVNHLDLAGHVFILSVCSACGQLFIFHTISSFGPVVFTLIMTSRQAISIILSCIVYGHILSPLALIGTAVVFFTILLRLYLRQRAKK